MWMRSHLRNRWATIFLDKITESIGINVDANSNSGTMRWLLMSWRFISVHGRTVYNPKNDDWQPSGPFQEEVCSRKGRRPQAEYEQPITR